MRNFVLGMAMASTALASPALARDNSWYIGADLFSHLSNPRKSASIPSYALKLRRASCGLKIKAQLYCFVSFALFAVKKNSVNL